MSVATTRAVTPARFTVKLQTLTGTLSAVQIDTTARLVFTERYCADGNRAAATGCV